MCQSHASVWISSWERKENQVSECSAASAIRCTLFIIKLLAHLGHCIESLTPSSGTNQYTFKHIISAERQEGGTAQSRRLNTGGTLIQITNAQFIPVLSNYIKPHAVL